MVAAGAVAEVTIHGDRKHPGPGPAPAADTELPASPRLLAREADIGLTLRPRHAAQVHRCPPRTRGLEAGGQAASTPDPASSVSPVNVPILGLALCPPE